MAKGTMKKTIVKAEATSKAIVAKAPAATAMKAETIKKVDTPKVETTKKAESKPEVKTKQETIVKASANKTTISKIVALPTSVSNASDTMKAVPQSKAPAKEISKETPTKEVPTKETPTKETPAKDAPAKEIPKAIKENAKDFKKGISAGATIRECFLDALKSKVIDDKAMEILTDAEKTKEVLKIRYAFLLEVKSGKKEERMVNGCPRYTSKPIVEYGNKKYYITNDLYIRNVATFKDWIKSLKKDSKKDSKKVEKKETAKKK